MNDADIERFRGFVRSARWRFARTYVDSYPHEYALIDWVDRAVFEAAIDCIERWGVIEPFWRSRRKYLNVDGRKYWHMSDLSSDPAAERPTLINRAWLEIANYRPEAEALGYDGPAVDRLVSHWEHMLERAKRAH